MASVRSAAQARWDRAERAQMPLGWTGVWGPVVAIRLVV